MKATFHKSCSCRSCRARRGGEFGQFIHRANEHKLRRIAKRELRKVLKGLTDDAIIAPIGSPYTD